MKNTKWITVCLVCLCSCIAHAGVIAAWDFEAGTASTSAAAGWTSFTPVKSGALPSSTVRFAGDEYAGNGSVTLKQVDYIDAKLVDRKLYYQQFSVARPLLPASDNALRDGFKTGTQPSEFELSGLKPGQTYRLQFLGVVLDKAEIRDLQMTVGTTTVELFNNTLNGSTGFYQGGYSPTITCAADANGTVHIVFTHDNQGSRTHVSGLIVATGSGPDVTDSVAKTAPDPKEVKPVAQKTSISTQAKSIAKKTGSGMLGLIIVAPILLLIFRRS